MNTEHIEINGKKYLVKIYHEDRRNARVSITSDSINIRLPDFVGRDAGFRELMKMKMWAVNKLKENPERFKPEVQKNYKDGDVLKVGNEGYILKIEFEEKESSSVKVTGNVIEMAISSNLSTEKQKKHISTLLSRCIARKRLPELHRKLNELNTKHFNQKINKIFFKNTKSRWGSCSEAGNINISTRLLFAPDEVLESVCIHELAHLIEQNHSEKFWALVEQAMPNYKEADKWLKENGGSCGF